MKFTVNAGELSAALRGPCDRARTSAVIPILKHVLFSVEGPRLSILGHDLDSSSESFVDVETASPGACAIPAEPIVRIVNGLPKAASVVFEIDGRNVTIRSGRSRYKLPILDAADMPLPLVAENGLRVTVSAGQLEQLFSRQRAAVNLKHNQGFLRGVYLHNEAKKLSSAATTGYVLLRFSSDIDAGDFKGAIIPKSAADEILKMGAGELSISDRIVSIAAKHQIYSSRIIDATFPDYRRVIPELDGTKIVVDRDALIECVSRLSSIGTFIESDLIDISIGVDELSISMTGTADGAENIECEASESAFICLKGSQLLDALKAMRGESLELYIRNENSAFRIVDRSEPDAINVLMPCASKTNRRAKAA